MKTCITHSFACDCREEKFKQLEAENAELRKDLETIRNYESSEMGKCHYIIKDMYKENAALKSRIEKLREALEFYGARHNFENGVISSKDIEPAEKIIGKVISHYTEPPEVHHVYVGGKTARAALKEDDENLVKIHAK